jgi:hypothetical protein
MSNAFPKQPAAPTYSRAIMWAAVQMMAVFVFAALILDYGRTLRACIVAAAVFWTCALGMMLWQRQPRPWTLFAFKYGLLILAAVAALAVSASAYWSVYTR